MKIQKKFKKVNNNMTIKNIIITCSDNSNDVSLIPFLNSAIERTPLESSSIILNLRDNPTIPRTPRDARFFFNSSIIVPISRFLV